MGSDDTGEGSPQETGVPAARVRPGHWAAVRFIALPTFVDIAEYFDERPEIGGTYFRPCDNRLQPVDLKVDAPNPMTNVGGGIALTPSASVLAASMQSRVRDLLRKRETATPLPEKQLEATHISAALTGGLRLDAFGPTLRFIANQVRLEVEGESALPDILAVDTADAALVVIELRDPSDGSAAEEVRSYVDTCNATEDLTKLFSELATNMAMRYECDDMPKELVHGTARGLVAWPKGDTLELTTV